MMDVLQEQENFEEDANAVLGGSDDKNCTYSKGYIKRQALYACMTCCSEAKSDPAKRAGLCLACSLTCHENHELIELYTKRNFRCDCGNSKFNSNPCQLAPKKANFNEENSYNQNFSGVYCVCRRPYPDPDCETEDVMIQCTICEDWYHGTHLETTVPNSELYTEMICKGCMEKYDFLHSYSYMVVNVESSDVDVINVPENGIKTRNGDFKTDATAVEDSERSQENEDISLTPKKEISSIDENIEENKKKVENDGTNNSKMEGISDVDVSVENPSSESLISCNNKDNTDIKEEGSNADNTNDRDTSSDQSQDIINSEIQRDMELNKNNTAKEIEDKNAMKTTSEVKNRQDENTDEEKPLVDYESESCKSKMNLDITETSQEDIKTTHENGKMYKKNDADNTINRTSELNNLEKGEGTEEKTENLASHDEKDVVQNTSKGKETKNEGGGNCSNPVDGNYTDAATDEVTGDSNHKGSEKRKLSTEETTDSSVSKKSKLGEVTDKPCTCPKNDKKVYRGATFWPSTFRQRLCTCNECLSMYKDLSVMFLMDTEDTVVAYESLGKEKTNGKPSQYEKGLQALSSLDRIQQINALTEYNKMRDKLLDFLKSFKDRKEIVKEEDIKAFFAGMKPKREPEGVYFCR
ncbi:hypothetical protein KGM_202770 [Danaus plexippus plexippus]|uniref:UBR-type domain-containing protein n=1 Tax=Danaus plexippus plexippus TaxID=278856 RepID=A0A212F203_DANPL|nr:hypothetical protein KGM_202770 [Danaus plexippus plexippus]